MNGFTRGSPVGHKSDAVRWKTFVQRAFFHRDPFTRFQFLEMRRTDVRDESAGRLCDGAEIRDIAGPVRAHFDDNDFMAPVQIQERCGSPNMIVEISLRAQNVVFRSENGRDEFLRSRLSVAARDRDKRNRKAAPVFPRDLSVRAHRILHDEERLRSAFG